MSRFKLIAVSALAAAACGCHTYAPANLEVVPQQAAVRVQVDDETAAYLRQLTGSTSSVGRFEGEVIRSSADSLWLTMSVATGPNPPGRETIGQRVILSRSRISSLEIRELDRGRTAALSAVGAGVVVFAAVKLFSGSFGGSTIGSPPGPVDIRLPLGTARR